MVNLLQVWDATSSNPITVLKTKLIYLSTNGYYVLINQVLIQTFVLDSSLALQTYNPTIRICFDYLVCRFK